MPVVLRLNSLGKRYQIPEHALDMNGGRITDRVFRGFTSFFKRSTPSPPFWALRNVSFEVHEGEVVGIVGRNGAGKSTLLRVLSKVTQPSEGTAEVHGRVGALLEVGIGFHPELTGRENIFLNGTILGMSKAEVRKKMDAIVSFAGVEKFLDVPTKRYSSGMYVRLAFAVAANLEPDILIVDEVLAVGDAAFQRACIEKMQEVSREGRTILFVSHNTALLSRLCKRGLYLEDGQLKMDSSIDEVLSTYLSDSVNFDTTDLERCRLVGTGHLIRFTEVKMAQGSKSVAFGDPIVFRCVVESEHDFEDLRIGLTVNSSVGAPVGTAVPSTGFAIKRGQRLTLECQLHNLNLAPGHYNGIVSVGTGGIHSARTNLDLLYGIPHFEVLASSTKYDPVAEWHRAMGDSVFMDGQVRVLDVSTFE